MRKQYNCHVRSFAGFCVLLASCMTASVAALSSEAPKSFIGGEPLQQEKNTGATGVASNGVIQVVPGAYMHPPSVIIITSKLLFISLFFKSS